MFPILSLKERLFLISALFIFIMLLLGSIVKESWTFDEGVHIETGNIFLTKQDFTKEPFNPPLARELMAIPTLFNPMFLQDKFLIPERLIIVIISCLFLLSLYFITRKLFGISSGVFMVILYIFEPEILAHSHYATTDLMVTTFVVLSFLLFLLWKDTFTYKRLIILSICIGVALSSKISALPFFVVSFLFIYIFDVCKKRNVFSLISKQNLINACVLTGCVAITIWSTYFFTMESAFGKFTPHNTVVKQIVAIPGVYYLLSEPIPLGGFIRTVKQVVLYNYSSQFGKPAFIMQQISAKGFWYFFPLSFLLKTPIPLLILLVLAGVYTKKNTQRYILLPVLSIFLCGMISSLNLGIRYILPVYPLLIVYISQLASPQIIFKRKYFILTLLLSWYVAGVLSVYPHPISFMNEFTGKMKNKHHYLIDSNYDWGQGLVDLKAYQDNNAISKLQLAYFGMVDPHLYGISYQRIRDISYGDKAKVKELNTNAGSTVAISASCFYFCGYHKVGLFAHKIPDEIIGGSILIFRF